MNILTDTGCSIAACTRAFANEHNLPIEKSERTYEIEGVTNDTIFSNEFVTFKIRLRKKGTHVVTIRALVLPGGHWTAPIPTTQPPWLSDLKPYLAMPEICSPTNNRIEYQIILGGDYLVEFKFHPIYSDQRFSLVSTLGGWLPRGRFTSECTNIIPQFASLRINSLQARHIKTIKKLDAAMDKDCLDEYSAITEEELNRIILEYYKLDQIQILQDIKQVKRDAQEELREYIQQNLSYSDEGRIIAKLPKREDFRRMVTKNGNTGQRRIKSVERMLEKQDEVAKAYVAMFESWVRDGVVIEKTIEELDADGEWTELPHFGVINDSETTPVRMVITGDAKDKGQFSTNDWLLPGPNVLPLIPTILTHIRMKEQFLVADISKAFVQIQLSDEDKKLLVFRWPVKQPDGTYQHKFYRFERMPWGINCAPFVLNASLRKIFREKAANNPAERELMQDFENHAYLDDVAMTGDHDEETVSKAQKLKDTVSPAFFNVTKFKSYPPRLTEPFGVAARTDPFKILGLGFDPLTDTFFIKSRKLDEYRQKEQITKKDAASILARPFDPLGFLTPVMLQAKILRQKIDTNHPKADWKQPLSKEETQEWHQFTDELVRLPELKIPRLMRTKGEKRREYHLFTDASGLAIGAVLYAVSYDKNDKPTVSLIAAKSKIIPRTAPSKKNPMIPEAGISINKLELNGILLGLQLVEMLKESLEKPTKIHCWTDSLVSLAWIKNQKQTGVKYVDTRLEKIWTLSSPDDWNHCPGKENPADMSTRPCSMKELLENETWTSGPEWLRNTNLPWPNNRAAVIKVTQPKPPCDTCAKYPLPTKCKVCGTKADAVARCRQLERYIHRGDHHWEHHVRRYHYLYSQMQNFYTAKRKPSTPRDPIHISKPTAHDFEVAQINLIRDIQRNYEPDIWRSLQKNPESMIDGLVWNPVLRLIMSRSRQSRTDEIKSPIEKDLIHLPVTNNNPLKPGTNPFTRALMDYSHRMCGHGPMVSTFTHLRQKYWCARARKIAKEVKRDCPACKRFDIRPLKAPQAPLRDYRYIGDKKFETMGVDFVGPFHPLTDKRRPISIIVFSCPLTRLVLLRAVENVGAEEFRHVLNSVCNEHNLNPKIINSDRAKTFINVWERTIEAHHLEINKDNHERGPQPRWDFNAARAPWWGGFYERMMTLIKDRMARCIQRSYFKTFAAFNEGISFIQKVINMRPLAFTANDEENPIPLTPNLFLHADPPTFSDPYNYGPQILDFQAGTKERLEASLRMRRKWQRAVWDMFHNLYISELRKRRETAEFKNDCLLKEGQVVLYKPQGLFRENTPQGRLKWRLGRIKKLHKSPRDGRVRSVDLELYDRKAGTLYTLPSQTIQNLAPLELELTEMEARAAERRSQLRRSERIANAKTKK